MVVLATLLMADEHLFTLNFALSVCVSAEETMQTLNEWEFTFLMILSNTIYNARKISAVVLTLQVPAMILNDAACWCMASSLSKMPSPPIFSSNGGAQPF